ncbi:hypothetical protein HY468_02805 [Candidatus Roizmanbacteria bacterium]|nr:hypothetical protein [Candidatus Roizmanbacteria bacterium]
MERKKTKKQIGILIFLFILLASLPIAIFLTRQRQDVRPRAALPGQANFKLSASDDAPDAGESITVTANLDVTDDNVRVSGVDFRILYSKDLFEADPTIVAATGDDKPFTDVIVTEVDKSYSEELNYLRLVLVARKLTPQLAGGNNIPLATITFTAKDDGDATIKYPEKSTDENGVPVIQVVGIELGGNTPTPSPTENP